MILIAMTLFAEQLVVPGDAYLKTEVAGLENTQASSTINGNIRKFVINTSAKESNATQLTLLNSTKVQKNDLLQLTVDLRGDTLRGGSPARVEFLFEKSSSPWTKSFNEVASAFNSERWKTYRAYIKSAETYQPGEAMLSVRLALQPQTVELRTLSLVNLGPESEQNNIDTLRQNQLDKNHLGTVNLTVDTKSDGQIMEGLGGNFCQPRYSSSEAMDKVGEKCLSELNVTHARIGIPLNFYNPQRGVYKTDGPPLASMKALSILKRNNRQVIASVWEPGRWLLGGKPEEMGIALPKEKYPLLIEGIVSYLLEAKKRFAVEPDYFSFNEPDYGVNIKFSPTQLRDFIRQCGPAFEKAGLKTKFLTADTANGTVSAEYGEVLLSDPQITKFLGPFAFHSWDALTATDEAYQAIAKVGKKYKKQIWCTEAGHDAQLWQQKDPWNTWENAFRTALAYERTVRLTGSSTMLYWTYQDNYPLANNKTSEPYPVFEVMQLLDRVYGKAQMVQAVSSNNPEVHVTSTAGPAGRKVLILTPTGSADVKLSKLGPKTKYVVIIRGKNLNSQPKEVQTDGTGTLNLRIPARAVAVLESK